MRIYLSGWQSSNKDKERRVVASGVVKHRGFSFAYIKKLEGFPFYQSGVAGAYKVNLDSRTGIMMDSGVFSYRSYKRSMDRKGKDTSKLIGERDFVREYVKFCKHGSKQWDFFLTVDFEKNASKCLKEQLALEKMGIRPVPAFHGDDSVEYIRRYVDMGYKFIAVAPPPMKAHRSPRQYRDYLDTVFGLAAKLGVKLHGLALTVPWMMLDFPWYSLDSSSWSALAVFGKIMRYDEISGRVTVVHYSSRSSTYRPEMKMNRKLMDGIKETIISDGFDPDKIWNDSVDRHIYNAAQMMKIAEVAEKRHRGGSWIPLI